MDPEDFRYRVADDGRIAIAGLTLEETLELEALLRRQSVAADRACELRLLELFLKHDTAFTNRRWAIAAGSSTEPPDLRQARYVGSYRRAGRVAGAPQGVQVARSAVAIGMASAGLLTLCLIIANI
jgi:hypothetical protein